MEFVEQLKSQVDIVRTVAEYVRLRKLGARFVGLCPFHTEKTPSFNVSPSIQIYKCFGCGVSGDVIKFVQEIESLTFWEALKSIADRNGIAMPKRREYSDAETDLRASIFEMYEAAAKIYQEALFGTVGEGVRDYLVKRGMTAAVAQQFGLGFAEPGWDHLTRRFVRKYDVQQMEKSGLFGRREDGGFFDRFRGRLIFPIHNESGKVIAFGGRAVRSDDEPKYLNSPETPIYKKSTILYNLHRAKETIRKADRAVLVEGYMDVIGVFAAGVRNVVASCGTALTSQQVRSIKRHSENIVVNFDPDVAGANAAERSIQMLLDEGMHVRILELDGGLDPDEYIKEHGAPVYQTRLAKAAGYFIWLADRARKKTDMTTAEGRMAGYESTLLPAIRRISDRLERAAVAAEVADYLGLNRDLVLAEFRRIPGQKKTGAEQPRQSTVPARELDLVRSLVVNPEIRPALLARLQTSAAARNFSLWKLIQVMLRLFETSPQFMYESLDNSIEESERALLSSVVFADHHREAFTTEHIGEILAWLDSEDLNVRISDLDVQIRQSERSGNVEEALRLMAARDQLRRTAAVRSSSV